MKKFYAWFKKLFQKKGKEDTKTFYKKRYEILISRIEKINPEAVGHLRDLENGKGFSKCGSLQACFIWKCSPQGYDYWSEISKKLKENEPEVK